MNPIWLQVTRDRIRKIWSPYILIMRPPLRVRNKNRNESNQRKRKSQSWEKRNRISRLQKYLRRPLQEITKVLTKFVLLFWPRNINWKWLPSFYSVGFAKPFEGCLLVYTLDLLKFWYSPWVFYFPSCCLQMKD